APDAAAWGSQLRALGNRSCAPERVTTKRSWSEKASGPGGSPELEPRSTSPSTSGSASSRFTRAAVNAACASGVIVTRHVTQREFAHRGVGRASRMPRPMAAWIFKQVTKSFGQVSVIEGLDLEIQDREFMVLVGPSGCGKSTALRMIAGLEEITGGTISIGDRVVNDVPPKDRDVAMVFQSYALYPHMTVRENL